MTSRVVTTYRLTCDRCGASQSFDAQPGSCKPSLDGWDEVSTRAPHGANAATLVAADLCPPCSADLHRWFNAVREVGVAMRCEVAP